MNCRYSAKNRAEILESRVLSTRAVGAAIAKSARPPRTWLQASTATIYAHRYDAANDETVGIIGGREPNAPDTWKFSIRVAQAWEAALEESKTPSTRKVALRSAIILSPEDGGIFATLLGLAHRGVGGRAGDGRQYVSWIHDADFTRAIHWIIEHEHLGGVVNVAAPSPLPQEDFARAIRRAAGIGVGLPAMKWMLEIGAVLLRTETELILKSRRVVPTRLLESGFVFTFPNWNEAAYDLVRRRETAHAAIPPAPSPRAR